MNVVFFGTSRFAVRILQTLVESQHKVSSVVTTPDKPAGRGLEMLSSPVKKFVLTKGLHLMQPDVLTEYTFLRDLHALSPDVIVVASYGKKIPDQIISLPRFRSLNVHPSLLPRYRGASPIQSAIINGETLTGVTIAGVTSEMDAGPIMAQRQVKIMEDTTAGELESALQGVASQLVLEVMEQIALGKIQTREQDRRQVTISRKFTREDTKINWSQDVVRVYNFIRAFLPSPAPFSFYKGARLKILKARPVRLKERPSFPPGVIALVDKESFHVSCIGGTISVTSVQPENKNVMTANDFINGFRVALSDVLQ
jgi:methionyl-tRNA formyltransferase